MNQRSKKIINYLEQPAERKKVTNMLKAGKIKKITGRKMHASSIRRNRVVTIILAWILFAIGFVYVIF